MPYQVVGLVVGPKGTTIKRIQQSTNTYIVTPSRDCTPVFEIQGSPDNVAQARKEIENYILLRTATPALPMSQQSQMMSSSNGKQCSVSSSSASSSHSDKGAFGCLNEGGAALSGLLNGGETFGDDFYAGSVIDLDDFRLGNDGGSNVCMSNLLKNNSNKSNGAGKFFLVF